MRQSLFGWRGFESRLSEFLNANRIHEPQRNNRDHQQWHRVSQSFYAKFQFISAEPAEARKTFLLCEQLWFVFMVWMIDRRLVELFRKRNVSSMNTQPRPVPDDILFVVAWKPRQRVQRIFELELAARAGCKRLRQTTIASFLHRALTFSRVTFQ